MVDEKTIFSKIEDLIPFDKIDALYLFGSYANGDYTEESDVDIAVFSDKLTYLDIVDLEDNLAERLNKEVDLVLADKENTILLREILQGKPLIESTKEFDEWLERFSEWVANEYWFIQLCLDERCGLYE